MKQYLELMEHVLENGVDRMDRTGVGTRGVFGQMLRFDLQEGFPLLTTKKVSLKNVATELFWFIKGDTKLRYLLQNKNNIWNEWGFKKWVTSPDYDGPDMTDFGLRAEKDPEFAKIYKEQMESYKTKVLTDDEFNDTYGDLGDVYGKQWRRWIGSNGKEYDQLKKAVEDLKNNPNSRRTLVSAWDVEAFSENRMALPPCHYSYQFAVYNGKVSCIFNMRSNDVFLGLPYNIASYALLTHLIANECGYEVGELIYVGADVHIYHNHFTQCKEQLSRTPGELPTLEILSPEKSMFDMEWKDIRLNNYNPQEAIKAPVAV